MLSETFFSQNAVLLPVTSRSLIDKEEKEDFRRLNKNTFGKFNHRRNFQRECNDHKLFLHAFPVNWWTFGLKQVSHDDLYPEATKPYARSSSSLLNLRKNLPHFLSLLQLRWWLRNNQFYSCEWKYVMMFWAISVTRKKIVSK